MGKLTKKYSKELKQRKKHSHTKTKLTPGGEPLLQEFLTAREELESQFEKEKKEIISNYERRNKYLRNLLEEYSEKIDMLKLNLEAEKEDNKILKEKVSSLEIELEKIRENFTRTPNVKAVVFFDSYKYNIDIDDIQTLRDHLNYIPSETSDFGSNADITSISSGTSTPILPVITNRTTPSLQPTTAQSSPIFPPRTARSTPLFPPSITKSTSLNQTLPYIGIHQNCREEFNRLLEEIRLQGIRHEEQLETEKRNMRIEFEREKLRIEQSVFKQLNSKLEKELRRREQLVNERESLRHTISRTIAEATIHNNKHRLLSFDWAETNSDSGADVGDNRSDDDADTASRDTVSTSRDDRSEKSTNTCSNFINDILCNTVIGDILREQKNRLINEFQNKFQEEKKKFTMIKETWNGNIASLVNENDWLKRKASNTSNYLDDVTNLQVDFKEKLLTLEKLLDDDPYAC